MTEGDHPKVEQARPKRKSPEKRRIGDIGKGILATSLVLGTGVATLKGAEIAEDIIYPPPQPQEVFRGKALISKRGRQGNLDPNLKIRERPSTKSSYSGWSSTFGSSENVIIETPLFVWGEDTSGQNPYKEPWIRIGSRAYINVGPSTWNYVELVRDPNAKKGFEKISPVEGGFITENGALLKDNEVNIVITDSKTPAP